MDFRHMFNGCELLISARRPGEISGRGSSLEAAASATSAAKIAPRKGRLLMRSIPSLKVYYEQCVYQCVYQE